MFTFSPLTFILGAVDGGSDLGRGSGLRALPPPGVEQLQGRGKRKQLLQVIAAHSSCVQAITVSPPPFTEPHIYVARMSERLVPLLRPCA